MSALPALCACIVCIPVADGIALLRTATTLAELLLSDRDDAALCALCPTRVLSAHLEPVDRAVAAREPNAGCSRRWRAHNRERARTRVLVDIVMVCACDRRPR